MIKNYMEDVVLDVVNKIWCDKTIHTCKCNTCKDDIMAISLNNLPPKYFASSNGNVWLKLMLSDNQKITDVISAVTSAIEIVSNNPHHD